jgi:hypothetical protein
MKYHIIIITLLITFTTAYTTIGQNLVQNPSFEDITFCPTSVAQIDSAEFWSNPIITVSYSTPDLFNACSLSNLVQVPSNNWGYQNARTGVGYVGFVAYYESYPDFREYLQGNFSSPLQAGESYEVSFWISLSENSYYSISNIGVFFSDTLTAVLNQPPPNISFLQITPQVSIDSLQLDNTSTWQKIEWTYTAQGGEEHFIIGNFEDDNNTTYAPAGGSHNDGNLAYYYIDDVAVTRYITSQENISNVNYFNLFPNPASDKVFIELEFNREMETTVEIFDLTGKKVYSSYFGEISSRNIEIATSQFQNGLYVLRVNTGEEILSKKIVISHK